MTNDYRVLSADNRLAELLAEKGRLDTMLASLQKPTGRAHRVQQHAEQLLDGIEPKLTYDDELRQVEARLEIVNAAITIQRRRSDDIRSTVATERQRQGGQK